jgi:GTPase SAR1 family protein
MYDNKKMCSSDPIKCLMIGQHGIGKSTFLRSFPGSQIKEPSSQQPDKETYTITSVNEKLEPVEIQIDIFDIALDTCLRDSDLVINNKVIPSTKIITTSSYKCVILCFAMNDLHSFHLIKSKWEIEFKKNKARTHSFVLLGLKSDTTHSDVSCRDILNQSNAINRESDTATDPERLAPNLDEPNNNNVESTHVNLSK